MYPKVQHEVTHPCSGQLKRDYVPPEARADVVALQRRLCFLVLIHFSLQMTDRDRLFHVTRSNADRFEKWSFYKTNDIMQTRFELRYRVASINVSLTSAVRRHVAFITC